MEPTAFFSSIHKLESWSILHLQIMPIPKDPGLFHGQNISS